MENPFRYRGYYFDQETGFYYLQSRYYDPSIGRFINADEPTMLFYSAGNAGGANLYAYCLNNPVMRIDIAVLSYSTEFTGLYGSFGMVNSVLVNDGITFGALYAYSWIKYKKPPNPNQRHGALSRQKTGLRERNIKHPNGEEHSIKPKGGNRPRVEIPWKDIGELIVIGLSFGGLGLAVNAGYITVEQGVLIGIAVVGIALAIPTGGASLVVSAVALFLLLGLSEFKGIDENPIAAKIGGWFSWLKF